MGLLTKNQRERLRANHRETVGCMDECREEPDHVPVVRFFAPWRQSSWLITELLPDYRLYGLYDHELEGPKRGYVHLRKLERVRGPGGLKIERDMRWRARGTLNEYSRAASKAGRIVELEEG